MKYLIRLLDPVFLLGFVFIISIIFILSIRLWRNNNDYIFRIFFLFLLFCASIILLNGLFRIFPQKTDSMEDYIPLGLTIADILKSGPAGIYDNFSKLLSDRYLPYTFWVGSIFAITENSLLAASFLSSIFGALIIYMIFQISRDIFDLKTAKWSALLWALSPFFIYMSVVIMRDTMVTFFILWFYRSWLQYDKSNEKRHLWLMVFTLLITGLLRPPIMAVMVASLLSYKFLFEKKENQSQNYRILIRYLKIVTVVFGILAMTLYFSGLVNVKGFLESRLGSGLKYTEMEAINQKLRANKEAGSNYYPVASHDSLVSIFTNMPLLVLYFLGSPFPWQVQKGTQMAALVDSGVIWLICLLFLLEIRSFFKRNKKWAVILFTYLFLGICSAAIVQTNAGGSQRHRMMFTTLLLPFAVHRVLTWGQRKKKGREFQGRYLLKGNLKPAVWKDGMASRINR